MTTTSKILRDTVFTSKTGRVYEIDANGRALPLTFDDSPTGCECEIDWNCPLHRGGYTALELRNDEWASRNP